MAENGLVTPPRERPTPTTPPAPRRRRLTPSCANLWLELLFPHVPPEQWESLRATSTPPIPSSPPLFRQDAFSGPPFQRD